MKPLNLSITVILAAIFTVFVYSQSEVNEHCIKFENPTTATLVGEDGIIMKTTDNGLTWAEQLSGLTNTLYGLSTFDANNSFTVGENGTILKTTDGGNTWVIVISGVTVHLYDVEALALDNIFVCGENGTILNSTDAGDTWNPVANSSAEILNDIKFYNSSLGFIVGNNGTVLKTEDGGLTWNLMSFPLNNSQLNSVAIASSSVISVVGNVDGNVAILYRSDDGGNTWLPYEEQFSAGTNLYDILYFNANDGILTGNNGMILKTDNGGLSWFQTHSTAQATDFYSVSFGDINNGISVGANGTEIYTTDGGFTWSQAPPMNNPVVKNQNPNKISASNYPNPFNPSTKISFVLPKAGNIVVSVFDITGKEIKRLFDGYASSGTQEYTFNAANLSSGVYFYSITAEGSKPVTNKMILTK